MKYKEVRKLCWDDLRKLCMRHEWYTRGNNAEYDKMLNLCEAENITTDIIVQLATDIKAHSNTDYDISSICFEISEISHTFFEIDE